MDKIKSIVWQEQDGGRGKKEIKGTGVSAEEGMEIFKKIKKGEVIEYQMYDDNGVCVAVGDESDL